MRGRAGPHLVGASKDLQQLRDRATHGIATNKGMSSWTLDGVSFCEDPIDGEMAFVFTGAASAYPEMGHDLFSGLPSPLRRFGKHHAGFAFWL